VAAVELVLAAVGSGGDGGLDIGPSTVEDEAGLDAGGDATTSGSVEAVPDVVPDVVPDAGADAVDDAVRAGLALGGLLVGVELAAELLLGGVVVRTCTMPSFPEHAARPVVIASTATAVAPAVRVPRRPIAPALLKTPSKVTHGDESSRIGTRR
jgi:hypothetical protein